MRQRSEALFDSVRSGQRDHFFYLPNFCVAEVFSVFMKHSFGAWNSHVAETIDNRHYKRIVDQFANDIHNGSLIYHYELARYHILGINLVAPVDHYYQISRSSRRKRGRRKGKMRKRNVTPMGTFDHLIISMGVHLAHIHGRDNVLVVSGDRRLTDVLDKCKSDISQSTKRHLKLDDDRIEGLTGRRFNPETFPRHINFVTATKAQLVRAFGEWPLPVGKLPKVGRYLKL